MQTADKSSQPLQGEAGEDGSSLALAVNKADSP